MEIETDKVMCPKCNKAILKYNFYTHEPRCPGPQQTEQPKPQNSTAYHQQDEESNSTICPTCHQEVNFEDLERHMQNCMLECEYCGQSFPDYTFDEHQRVCPIKVERAQREQQRPAQRAVNIQQQQQSQNTNQMQNPFEMQRSPFAQQHQQQQQQQQQQINSNGQVFEQNVIQTNGRTVIQRRLPDGTSQTIIYNGNATPLQQLQSNVHYSDNFEDEKYDDYNSEDAQGQASGGNHQMPSPIQYLQQSDPLFNLFSMFQTQPVDTSQLNRRNPQHQRRIYLNELFTNLLNGTFRFDEFTDPSNNGGISKENLQNFPVYQFKKKIQSGGTRGSASEEEQRCCVCMCDFEEGDNVKVLDCFHKYHPDCIDPWLTKNSTCPVCKKDMREFAQQQL